MLFEFTSSVTGISVLKILVLRPEIPRKSFVELWSYCGIIVPLLTNAISK